MMNEDTSAPNTDSRPAAPPAPAAQQPPAKRRLPGWVYGLDTAGHLHGSLACFRARYHAQTRRLHVELETEDRNSIHLQADHAHSRAAIGTLCKALHEFTRLQTAHVPRVIADFERLAQVNCSRYREEWLGDEELRFEFLPHRDLIELAAQFSDADTIGRHYHARVYLTRTEAEALFHDLERGMADLERYEGLGE
jgi:hypothetical protein